MAIVFRKCFVNYNFYEKSGNSTKTHYSLSTNFYPAPTLSSSILIARLTYLLTVGPIKIKRAYTAKLIPTTYCRIWVLNCTTQ